mgnify:CR=1 FL=1
MSKIEQSKIPVTLGLDNLLEISVEQGVIDNQFNWKLVRERDGLTKQSKGYKSDFQEPTIGRSLLMSPLNHYFTWQTTNITEIVEHREGYVKFKTGNSTYELFKM